MDPLDEILKQIEIINEKIGVISEILRVTDIVDNVETDTPDAG